MGTAEDEPGQAEWVDPLREVSTEAAAAAPSKGGGLGGPYCSFTGKTGGKKLSTFGTFVAMTNLPSQDERGVVPERRQSFSEPEKSALPPKEVGQGLNTGLVGGQGRESGG